MWTYPAFEGTLLCNSLLRTSILLIFIKVLLADSFDLLLVLKKVLGVLHLLVLQEALRSLAHALLVVELGHPTLSELSDELVLS